VPRRGRWALAPREPPRRTRAFSQKKRSVCLSVWPCLCLCACRTADLSVCLPACAVLFRPVLSCPVLSCLVLSCLPVCLFFCLPVYLPVSLSVCLSVGQLVGLYPAVCLSVCLLPDFLSVHLAVPLSLCLCCLILSYFDLSCHVFYCLVLSCLVLSCLLLSCLYLSYLPCLVLSFRGLSCALLLHLFDACNPVVIVGHTLWRSLISSAGHCMLPFRQRETRCKPQDTKSHVSGEWGKVNRSEPLCAVGPSSAR
jgi:hypothetical protein